ncbi:hypothetical protein B9Z65_711 [Elsinoe australis]|uniref:Uncharacterized protein n=1 Tax=Elsinoe australis TaxID=40998 RepID=A0A2P8AJC9_9PEZI|nr:hypothetical protein B9Z65_711 [Elsinoe australis]
MAPNRALQNPRAEESQLSANRLTARERTRRARLSLTQADFERQKKADTEYLRRGKEVFKETDVYKDATTDAERKRLLDGEVDRLTRTRKVSGNHHSLVPTDYKGIQARHFTSWFDSRAEDDAPNLKQDYETEQDEKKKKEAERIKNEPKVKEEPKDNDSHPTDVWALGNTYMPGRS